MIQFFPKPLTGKHVLFFLCGFFGLMLTADVALIYWGLKTHPGEVSANAYQEGLDYNRSIEAAEAQAALDWTMGVKTETLDVAADRAQVRVIVTLTQKAGRALNDAAVTADFYRPVDDGLDRTVRLNRTRPGVYEGVAALSALGRWRLRVVAEHEGEPLRRDQDLLIK